MATQTLPPIRAPLPHYPRRFQASLTPPYHNDPKPDGPWPNQGGQGASDDNFCMSIPPAGESRNTPKISPNQAYPPMQPQYRSLREAPVHLPVSLPPLRHLSGTPPTSSDRRTGSPFGVYYIPNPQAELVEQQRAFRHSKSQMKSSPPVDRQRSQGLPSIDSFYAARSTQEGQHHARSFQSFECSRVRPFGGARRVAQFPPYNQPASAASSHYVIHSTQGQYEPKSRYFPLHNPTERSLHTESERNNLKTMAPSNQSSVQLMTVQSQDGSLHNIRVETQTAWKGADEKRRCNAAASARFRNRRKDKEREASMSISRLEQNVRDSNEDAEYYRAERDYWRSIAMQSHPKRHITRPPSPRLRRVSVAPSCAPSSTTGRGSEAC